MALRGADPPAKRGERADRGTSRQDQAVQSQGITAVTAAQGGRWFPVEQPTGFDLVINMKPAKAPGLTISPSLVLRAGQVVD